MTPFTVAGLTTIVGRVLPEPHAGLLTGLLFGTKTSLSREFYEALVASGTLHVIALSGMNISIMSRLLHCGLSWIVSRRVSSVLTIGMIWWFVWFVGPSPSIVRAAIMGSISVLAVVFGRQYWPLFTWVLAVGSMLLITPSWLMDISFQLSVLATLGIILFGGSDEAARHKRFGWGIVYQSVRENLRLTLAAQTFTVPLVWLYFHRVSLVSPVANVLIGWIIGPLTGLGWMTVLAGWICLPLGQVLGWFDWIALEYIVRTVYFVSGLPLSNVSL